MIVASGGGSATAWTVFASVVGTVIVFWAAHVYAGTVAHHGFEDGRVISIRDSLRSRCADPGGCWSPRSSLPASCSSVWPMSFPTTRDLAALWVCVAVLAVLGYIAFARRRAPWHIRVLGTLATAGFGIILVLLKSGIH